MQIFSAEKLLGGVEQLGEIPTEKDLLRNTIKIAWPSVLESFLISLVVMVDTIMVSSIGEHAIAAVGLTVQPKFIGLAIFLSLSVAVSAIVAHRKGENNKESANKVLMQALVISICLVIIISIISITFADTIIRFAGSAEDTHDSAVLYFRIIMGGIIFNVISMVVNAAQRGAGNTKIAMRTNMVSNISNVILNYLLIGGKLGFPKLGIIGAAIATVIGAMFACFMSIHSVLRKDKFICLRSYYKVKFDKKTLMSIVNIGSSTLAEQIFLRIGFLFYSILIAKLGTVAFASHQIGMNFMHISFSFGDGLSVAAISLVGQNLGAKRKDLAKIYGGVSQYLGLFFASCLSIIFLLFGKQLFMLFSDKEEILNYGSMIMKVIPIILFLQIPQVVYSGCLRGAGDTKFTALVSLISVAIVRPLLGFIFCYPLGLGLFGAWLGLSFDQIVRFVMTGLRFKSGKWMNFKV